MKDLKRVLSFVLCMAMLLSVLPAGVITARATEGTDAAVPLADGEFTPVTQYVENATVTFSDPKEVYVKVNSISAAGDYLIVNTGSASTSAHMLTASSSGVKDTSNVTVATGTNIDGNSVTYIESPAAAAIWTASVNSNGWRLLNSNTNRYLRYDDGLTVTNSASSATTWYSGTNTLYRTSYGSSRYVYYYSSNYGSGWTASSSTQNVYFYQKQTVDFGTKITASGTYAIEGDPAYMVRGVKANDTLKLNSALTFTYDDGEIVAKNPAGATYTVVQGSDIASVSGNTLTFTGKYGTAVVEVSYEVATGKTVTNYITVVAKEYIVPEDGTNDFPSYPAEGAIRHDKNATAVGSFSQTGVTKVELSMTGVPYSTNNEIDVVIMVDMSDSMKNNNVGRVKPARESAVNALEAIVKNEDGTINNSRVAVYTFNGYDGTGAQDYANAVDEVLSLESYQNSSNKTDTTKLTAAQASITNWIQNSNTGAGTNYGAALEKCYSVLKAAKEEYPERKQYVIFVTDGEPTTGFAYETSDGSVKDDGYNSAYSDGAADKYYTYTEYYSKQMRAAGVEVYSVGIQLNNSNANTILKKIGGNSTGTAYANPTTHADYAQFIGSNESADKLVEIFENIVNAIKQAATDVIVADEITDHYTMIFEAPKGSENDLADELRGQEFYIEVTDYALKAVTNDDGVIIDYVRDTATSLCKLYLGKSTDGSTYFAASDANGTPYAAPVFEQKAIGTKYYWTTDDKKATDATFSVGADGEQYYFTKDGNGEYNMTSGAYAFGTVDPDTETSSDLVLATPYFVYNAETKMLYWTAEKLSNTELALSYFLYLNNSAGEVGNEEEEKAPGTYLTNVEATLTYTNYQDNPCQVLFPVPQMTWKGAQVSYVFYLVNENGLPVNRAGRVIPFSDAVYVTEEYTESVVWNQEEGRTSLNADRLASELVPSVYDLYDKDAYYEIDVYESNDATHADHFIIEGGDVNNKTTTKVFNTKAGDRYQAYGAYSNTAGSYTSINSGKSYDATVTTGFDYCNTTVAFAVVWNQALNPDTVVVDFGLDVVIDVTGNDTINSSLVGIRADQPMNGDQAVKENSGVYTNVGGLQSIDIKENGATKYTASIVKDTGTVRFSQKDMLFDEPAVFYYESSVTYHDNGEQTGYMYAPVTVVPATSVYYEEEFIDFASYNSNGVKDETSAWEDAGESVKADQAEDRPGESGVETDLDADNNYGFDQAYENMSTYSMGVAKKITVNKDRYGEATFSFYGTGFDIIALTSNATGTITIEVKNEDDDSVRNAIVDTYFGVDENGNVVDPSVDNALYQVPVMKIGGLTYGKYTVTITAAYHWFLDHAEEKGSYDLYLDAIRIYNPAGEDETANDIYLEDGEAYPVYTELRNNIIEKSELNNEETMGAVFIDGDAENVEIADYISYGPNNELYLANGQAIAFNVAMPSKAGLEIADVQLGIKLASGDSVTYSIGNPVTTDGNTVIVGETVEVKSATDLYYSILKYAKNGTVVIQNNTEGAILSLTNLKVTYTEAPDTTTDSQQLYMDAPSAELALMGLKGGFVEKLPEPEQPLPEQQTGNVEDVMTGLIGKFFGWIFD